MIMNNYDDYFGGLTEEEYREETERHFKELELLCRDATPEEEQRIQENIDKISKSIGVNFNNYLKETLENDDELRKEYEAIEEEYKALEKQIREDNEKQKYLNIPSCYRCIYEDKCPVYWHLGNAACITIFKNKFIKA